MQEDAEKGQAEIHKVQISVDREGDHENPRVVTDPNPCYIRPRDHVEWTCEDGPFAIQFEPLSPLTLRRLRTETNNRTIKGEVRPDNQPGSYRYFVAVEVNGQIFTEDPELIDDPDDRTIPGPN